MTNKIDPSEMTPEHVFINRRQFMVGAAALAAGSFLAACDAGQRANAPARAPTSAAAASPSTPATSTAIPSAVTRVPGILNAATPQASVAQDEKGNALSSYQAITGYVNYYEFSFDKENVGAIAQSFKTRPWELQVSGLVRQPKTFSLEELLQFPQEERVYRLRCVEGWSMVVPWVGFPLHKLLEVVKPTDEARFVRFQTAMRPEEMPGLKIKDLPWPYTEGLRLDEAMHDLTLLSTGIYGKPLAPENGAPIRLVVPWKYAFKYAKALVKIDLVKEMPKTFWASYNPQEYGFYANVNPEVPHPRWSQAIERRIGEAGRQTTLLFNGYEQEVAQLYQGMDLKVNY